MIAIIVLIIVILIISTIYYSMYYYVPGILLTTISKSMGIYFKFLINIIILSNYIFSI